MHEAPDTNPLAIRAPCRRPRAAWPLLAVLTGALLLAGALGTLPVRATEGLTGLPKAATEPVVTTPAGPEPAPWGPIIAIDPGHGGSETGAVHYNRAGRVDLVEKNVNLAIALRLDDILWERGYRTVLTRSGDTRVNVPARDLNRDGAINTDDDLQARVDIANEYDADLLLSIHNNGLSNPRVRGTSTWYCEDHPRGAESAHLAALLQEAFIWRLTEAGYDGVIDAGANDDAVLGKPYGHLFLVGPKTPRVARPSRMPGVIGESLYVTNDREASLLQDPAILDALALAYADAVDWYFTS